MVGTGLDHYDAKPFGQQQFETAGVEGVNVPIIATSSASFFPTS